MKIYIICSVRNATDAQVAHARRYTAGLRQKGHTVFWPYENAPQDDPTGFDIVSLERERIAEADRIDVLWDVESSGSHFDLGMAFALRKPIKRVITWQPDKSGKSYWKVMERWEMEELE